MIYRAYIHITGQAGAGKTTLMEAALDALQYESVLCVHAAIDDTLKRPKESAPRSNPHLKRYLDAGAMRAALYRFSRRRPDFVDAFFESDAMCDYSSAVFIEGDSPLEYLHLSAFVARPLAGDESLLVAGLRDTKAQHERELEEAEKLADHPERILELLLGDFGGALNAFVEKNPDILDRVRDDLHRTVQDLRARPIPEPTLHWTLAASHRGIETAGLVVVNIHDESERGRAEALVRDVARIRSDKEIFDHVLGRHHHRLPVTAVVANLSDPKDAGRKKAIARLKRAIAKAKEG